MTGRRRAALFSGFPRAARARGRGGLMTAISRRRANEM